jgi:hypothetical protein
MAKNFTDFQLVSGSYTPPLTADGVTPGVTNTQATSGMYLVGYDTDAPGGERRYTIESVLLAAQPYHAGLGNVTNESKQHMFNNSLFTGSTSAQNMTVLGDLVVEGDNVTMNTTIASTSALAVHSSSPDSAVIALEVQQYGPGAVARFFDGDDLALDIGANGHVGVAVQASTDTALTVLGDVAVSGDVFVDGNVNGRDITQDGVKIDNFGPYADMTALSLSNVQERLVWLKNNVSDYSEIDTPTALDVLEDGVQFKKTPALMTVGGTGIGDYSTEKLGTVEKHADVTGDHSGDIIFNQVPDGPYTGDKQTTYVKITSAGSDRLDSVRGVNVALYAGDDEQDITALHIRDAYHDAYPDFWSTANETEYRQDVLPSITTLYTTITPSSANWNDTHAVVSPSSANWNDTYSVVSPYSAFWIEQTVKVDQNADEWDRVTNSVDLSSGNWNQAYNSLPDLTEVRSHVNSLSDTWDDGVKNVDNETLPDGQAKLSGVTVQQLSAQLVAIDTNIYVLSAGEWVEGVTENIPLGDDNLQFVNGILVSWDRGGV